MNGALLIDKPDGLSSFGVIHALKKEFRNQNLGLLPALGHGGTLDPFATGVLVVLVGKAVKLARYFLGAHKSYEGVIRFGESSFCGDLTGEISETSQVIPDSLDVLNQVSHDFTVQPYLQTPPMHSAKKKNGQRLYELAREGIEIDREPKECSLSHFTITDYTAPEANFAVTCSSGTYIRVLAQDLAKKVGSVALLRSLRRTSSGPFEITNTQPLAQILQSMRENVSLNELSCWIPFNQLLSGYPKSQATDEEALFLVQGKQDVVIPLVKKAIVSKDSSEALLNKAVAVFSKDTLLGVLRQDATEWRIERVFT